MWHLWQFSSIICLQVIIKGVGTKDSSWSVCDRDLFSEFVDKWKWVYNTTGRYANPMKSENAERDIALAFNSRIAGLWLSSYIKSLKAFHLFSQILVEIGLLVCSELYYVNRTSSNNMIHPFCPIQNLWTRPMSHADLAILWILDCERLRSLHLHPICAIKQLSLLFPSFFFVVEASDISS